MRADGTPTGSEARSARGTRPPSASGGCAIPTRLWLPLPPSPPARAPPGTTTDDANSGVWHGRWADTSTSRRRAHRQTTRWDVSDPAGTSGWPLAAHQGGVAHVPLPSPFSLPAPRRVMGRQKTPPYRSGRKCAQASELLANVIIDVVTQTFRHQRQSTNG